MLAGLSIEVLATSVVVRFAVVVVTSSQTAVVMVVLGPISATTARKPAVATAATTGTARITGMTVVNGSCDEEGMRENGSGPGAVGRKVVPHRAEAACGAQHARHMQETSMTSAMTSR